MRDIRTTVAALVVLGALLIAPGAPAAPPLDLAGADALAASHGGSSGDLLGKWAAKASLAEILYVLRRAPGELGEAEAPLVEEALRKAASDRHALRARLVARLTMVAPRQFKKQLDLLAEGGAAPPRVRASVFRVAALLPGTGSYETYGRAVRLGLQYGLAEGRAANEPPIELRFWPTGDDDPGRTAAALDSALETCAVVVGELLSVPTMSIATGARIARAVVVSPTAPTRTWAKSGPACSRSVPRPRAARPRSLAPAARDRRAVSACSIPPRPGTAAWASSSPSPPSRSGFRWFGATPTRRAPRTSTPRFAR
jgi:hypothetical protein